MKCYLIHKEGTPLYIDWKREFHSEGRASTDDGR